jgi:hypothetical protein
VLEQTYGMAVFHLAADYGSTDPLRRTARLEPHIWTSPVRAQPGDLAVLYNTTDREWMAIGRIVHEPTRSRRDQRWWSYIQWFPVRRPLAYDEARRHPELADWKKLNKMAGRHAEVKPPEAADFILRRLTQRDPQAKARLQAWRKPGARLPAVVTRDLRDAWFEPSPPLLRLPDEHERWLTEEIAHALVTRRKARWRTGADGLRIGSADVVYLVTDRRVPRYPDAVLVDRTSRRTLLVTEVKRHARLSDLRGSRDVVDQVVEYRDLIRALDPSWRARAVIIAERVNDNVIARARDVGVEVWRFDARTRRFKALAGTYG